MKHFSLFLLLAVLLGSCQTRVVSVDKPFKRDALDLYHKYTFQLKDARLIKMEVLRIDNENVYGRSKEDDQIIIKQNDIREARKLDVFSSVAVGLAALAAVIFVPI